MAKAGAIDPIVDLLIYGSEECQREAAEALRNLTTNTNKVATANAGNAPHPHFAISDSINISTVLYCRCRAYTTTQCVYDAVRIQRILLETT